MCKIFILFMCITIGCTVLYLSSCQLLRVFYLCGIMVLPVNLSEQDMLAIGKDNLPKLLGTDPEYRNDVINLVKKFVRHDAYNNKDYNWSLDDFELGYRLGRGKFGRVFLAREKKTGLIIALKTLIKNEIKQAHVERQIMSEIEIQTHLQHPNILELYTWFNDEHRIYLVLEYAAGGELYGHLTNAPGGRFDERRSAKYIYQVAGALHYCHLNQVIHRDLKPENLMLTLDDNIKLADFGWSVHAPSTHRKTMCGTLDYLPPEMVEGHHYEYYVDNWCVGILCYEFLVGKPPFESKNSEDTYKRITSLDMEFPSYVSSGAKDLITRLLRRQGTARISLPDVMSHYWVVANKD